MFRDFWINESVAKLIQQHLKLIKENIRLKRELESKQKRIKYYKKEKKRLVSELDEAYKFIDTYVYHGSYTITDINKDTWCITFKQDAPDFNS